MAGTSSVSGLASGFDSAAFIDQLMEIEAIPKTQLETKQTAATNKGTAYRAVNAAFASLLSAAQKVTDSTTWSSTKATSSSSTVSASASASSVTGSLSFTVNQLATAHTVTSADVWATTSADTAMGTTMSFTTSAGTTSVDLDTNDDGTTSLAEAAAAINASSAGVKASVVNAGNGYRLQLTAASSGEAASFTLGSDTTATFDTTTRGQDAKLTIGSTDTAAGTKGYTVSSTSNTFSDVMAGVTFTVSQANVSSTISVSSDPAAVTDAVQDLVDAANNALTLIAKYTDKDTDAGVLSSDYSIKQLKNSLLDTITTAIGGKSASVAGLETDRYGAITFDAEKFTAKLKSDPSVVQSLFQGATDVGADNVKDTVDDRVSTDGLAARLRQLAARASDDVNGTLTVLADGMDSRVDDLTDQIENWTKRLEQREESLTSKYTAMESQLSTLSNQADWLSEQIDSLAGWYEN